METLATLIKFGVELDRRDPYLNSFLHEKARDKYFYLSQFGLEASSLPHINLNPNTTDRDGDTPLHVVITTGPISMTRLLLQQGANIDARNKKGRTLLMNAVDWCYPAGAVGRFLLEEGADLQIPDAQGQTALDEALNSEYPGIRDLVADSIVFKIRHDYAPHLARTLSSSFGS